VPRGLKGRGKSGRKKEKKKLERRDNPPVSKAYNLNPQPSLLI
jgi:hypothetical protein